MDILLNTYFLQGIGIGNIEVIHMDVVPVLKKFAAYQKR